MASFQMSGSDGHFPAELSGETTSSAFLGNSAMTRTKFIWNVYQII